MTIDIIHGEALATLRQLSTNSVDSIVTDPPAGINFMNMEFDKDKGGRDQWVNWLAEIMTEARRVLKPGGHALVWSIPRTSHWTGLALENAGYEIRDTIEHVTGQGMPKSHNIGEGRGTGLKPAHETWWLARSPLAESTVAANVLEYGTGALNIDACRIDTKDQLGRMNKPGANGWKNSSGGATRATYDPVAAAGRWPANFLMSHTLLCNEDGCVEGCPVAELDRQSGVRKSAYPGNNELAIKNNAMPVNRKSGFMRGEGYYGLNYSDQGGASRYFANFYYTPKASRRERNAGCDELPPRFTATMNDGIGAREHNPEQPNAWNGNHHVTVKPISLMRYLTRLVTPPGGTVLDMFAGSATTGVACVYEGFNFIGIEQEAEYVRIARARIAYAMKEAA